MKLRPDLVKLLTAEDFNGEVLANNHRYKAERNFSQTGVGSLSSASIEERAREGAHNTEFIRKVGKRQAQAGKAGGESNGV